MSPPSWHARLYDDDVLQIKQMSMRYADLAGRMRRVVGRLAGQKGQVEGCSAEAKGVVLWFLFVARISVLDGMEDEGLLASVAERVMGGLGLEEAGWEGVRGVLRGVMWIDFVHSDGGTKFLKVLGRGCRRRGFTCPPSQRQRGGCYLVISP
jgi:hypothetical protein